MAMLLLAMLVMLLIPIASNAATNAADDAISPSRNHTSAIDIDAVYSSDTISSQTIFRSRAVPADRKAGREADKK